MRHSMTVVCAGACLYVVSGLLHRLCAPPCRALLEHVRARRHREHVRAR